MPDQQTAIDKVEEHLTKRGYTMIQCDVEKHRGSWYSGKVLVYLNKTDPYTKFVQWTWTIENNRVSTFWGHYYADQKEAWADYINNL